jgi:hypothetical protein
MIPGIILTVTRSIFNTPYTALRYFFGHDDHSRVPSRFLLEGFFDALDAQYLRFSRPDALGFPACLGYLLWTNPCL